MKIIILILILVMCGVGDCKTIYVHDPVSGMDKPKWVDIMEVNENNFHKEVLNANMVLVDFWATWCKPCYQMTLNVDKMALNKDLKICKVDVDDNRKLMSKYGIRGLPTLIFFNNGKEVGRIVGLLPLEKIQKKWESIQEKKKDKDGCEGGICDVPDEYKEVK